MINMKPKRLKFVEHFIDEAPPEGQSNRFRGIMAMMDDTFIFQIEYYPLENEHDNFTHYELRSLIGDVDFQRKVRKSKPKTKEAAKKLAQEFFDDYVYSFCTVSHIN